MELKDYRAKLDTIDDQIAALFKERMETVKDVADYKKANNTPVLASGREREILLLRYGLSGTQPLTQREVADRCGISRSYVSRIEKKALQKLADCFEKKTP